MRLVRVVDPPGMLVSQEDLRLHLRVDGGDDDDLIIDLYRAAMAHIDGPRGVLGRCIQPQTWEAFPDAVPSGCFRLPLAGVDQVRAYLVDTDPREEVALTVSRCWPWTDVAFAAPVDGPVVLSMVASTPQDAWPAIRAAVKLLVGHWYENREAVVTGSTATTIPLAVERLLAPLKLKWV